MAIHRPYGNLSGKSGVAGYLIGTGWVEVKFKDGKIYTYNYLVTGKAMTDEIANRARAGYGLNRYLTTVVRGRYAEKR